MELSGAVETIHVHSLVVVTWLNETINFTTGYAVKLWVLNRH